MSRRYRLLFFTLAKHHASLDDSRTEGGEVSDSPVKADRVLLERVVATLFDNAIR